MDSVFLRTLGRVRALHDQADGVGCRGRRSHDVPHDEPRGADAAGRGHRGHRARRGLGRRRGRHGSDLHVPGPRRALDGDLLRDRALRRDRRQAGAEEPGIRVPRPRRQRAPARSHQLPREGRRGQRPVRAGGVRRPRERAHPQRRRPLRRVVVPLQPQVLRHRVLRRLDQARQPPAPHRLRARHPRGHPQGRRHLPRERHPHRVRPAQARHQPDVLPLRLRTGRQPHRVRQRRRPPAARPRPAGRGVEPGGAQEGSGVGHEDDRDVPHPRHAGRGRAPAQH